MQSQSVTRQKTLRLATLYEAFRADPGTVEPTWRDLFADLEPEARAWLESVQTPGPLAGAAASHGAPASALAPVPGDARAAASDSVRALMLIRAYRVRGHLDAHLDPLGLADAEPHAELQPDTYGFGEEDMDRPIFLGGVLGLETAPLREILRIVRRDYCGHIGLEYMHLQNPEQKAWIQEHMEGVLHKTTIPNENKIRILDRLTAAEAFEKFLDRKYTGTKRFGLDGGESAIPALEQIVRVGAELGIMEFVIGMSHRGRLNVLANIMEKPLPAIFSEFQGGAADPDEIGGSGDVKYHLGTSADREINGRPVHLSLTANPSHLEAVNPVVVGKARAKQDALGDRERTRIAGLLVHGDAAFSGQGLVAETLQFCDLPGYRTGGTVHLIINNQIGFTTNPMLGRSSPYCSDVAKMIQAPIVHVNGDDPEAVVLASRFAIEFRQRFKHDVVIDLYCYRRHGHNEGDEPAFTQPIMYQAIEDHPTTRTLYAERLKGLGIVTQAAVDKMEAEHVERLEQAFEAAKDYKHDKADWLGGWWSGLEPVRGYDARRGRTSVALETLREAGKALTTVPEGFRLHRKIERQLRTKRKMFETGEGIDWATAEALAFGALLIEGHPVRLSGEDSNRATFSQRHASWIDQEDETRYVPLNHIREMQERFEVLDSPLSEFGVLGFEYGYSSAVPNTLVLWEGQFGDFANGAQVMIDQFIAAGESKWLRMSGLVMLLPHGFEGQGPEHSSARLERYLQLCAEDNIQVVNCTTPANYFHVLRRQMHRDFRKPLIIMSPKSLLRHKLVVSRLEEMGPDTSFHRVLHDPVLPGHPAQARQMVLCSGKVYYDLVEEREKRGITDVHFLRVEQLYPFPFEALEEELAPYMHCKLVWCQEEPRNMGAWPLMSEMLGEVVSGMGFADPRIRYAGRHAAAAPATGVHARHVAEQARLVDEALTVGLEPVGRIQARTFRAEQAARNGKTGR